MLIRGCGGTKRHRKSHRSSPFNRRVKNLSVTGHLRSETKVRLLSSRRGPILTGRPRRHSRSALEQGEKRQGPPPNRKKPPQRSSSAFPKTAIHLLDSMLKPDCMPCLARMVDHQEPCPCCCASSRRAVRGDHPFVRLIARRIRRALVRLHRHTENGAIQRRLKIGASVCAVPRQDSDSPRTKRFYPKGDS